MSEIDKNPGEVSPLEDKPSTTPQLTFGTPFTSPPTAIAPELSSSEATTSDEDSAIADESAADLDSDSDSDSPDESTETSSESEVSCSEEDSVDLDKIEVGEESEKKTGGIGVNSVPSDRILDDSGNGKKIKPATKPTVVQNTTVPTIVSFKDTTSLNHTPIHSPQETIHGTTKLSQPSAKPELNSVIPSAHTVPDQMDTTSTKSNSSSDNFFASGGWGDEPEPAPWKWTQMPLDYMGILAEQRRTVFHEFRISDGKGEWLCPQYSGPPNYHDSQVQYKQGWQDKEIAKMERMGKLGRGRKSVNESATSIRRKDGDKETTRGIKVRRGGYAGRGRGTCPRGQFSRGCSTTRAKDDIQLVAEALQHLETPEKLSRPIIDTPIDSFDTAGLISPNPERASLPIIIIPNEETVKKSSAWSKEGKREREMSTLILPRPKRITMPSAILPTPEELKKLGKKRRGVDKVFAVTAGDVGVVDDEMNIVQAASSVDTSIAARESVTPQPVPAVLVNSIHMEQRTLAEQTVSQRSQTSNVSPVPPSNAPLEPAQLLLQLVNLLQDNETLAAFKSLVNSFDSAEIHSTSAVPSQDSPVDPVAVDTDVITPASAPIHGTSIKEGITGVTPEEPASAFVESITPAEEAVVFPSKKTKSTKSKSKDKSERPKKSKTHSKHSWESAARTVVTESRSSERFPSEAKSLPPSKSSVSIDDLSFDDELTRDDLWYNIPEDEDKDELEVGRLSTNGTYTLEDLKAPRQHAPEKLDKPAVPLQSHKTSAVKKTPIAAVEHPVNHTTGAIIEYNRTFRRVDAVDDLEIMSKPRLVYSLAKSSPVLDKPLELKSSDKSLEAKKVDEIKVEVPATVSPPTVAPKNERPPSTVAETPTPSPAKVSPILYDFNPPTPRRVTRRVVLYSKDEATQTSPPPSPSLDKPVSQSASPSEIPRPAATHHSRYYNTLPRSAVTPMPRTLTAAEIEALPKGHTGSDKIFMGTLKNVDAEDDLMIVSKPKDTIPAKKPKAEEKVCVSGFVDVASAVEFLRSKMESEPSGDISALYTLLTSPSGPLAAKIQEAVPEKQKKQKKEKQEKKEKKGRKSSGDSADKSRKEKSNSKRKSTTAPVEQAPSTSTAIIPAVDKDTTMLSKPLPVGMGDIFGDLLGDEMPKWDILNPTG